MAISATEVLHPHIPRTDQADGAGGEASAFAFAFALLFAAGGSSADWMEGKIEMNPG